MGRPGRGDGPVALIVREGWEAMKASRGQHDSKQKPRDCCYNHTVACSDDIQHVRVPISRSKTALGCHTLQSLIARDVPFIGALHSLVTFLTKTAASVFLLGKEMRNGLSQPKRLQHALSLERPLYAGSNSHGKLRWRVLEYFF